MSQDTSGRRALQEQNETTRSGRVGRVRNRGGGVQNGRVILNGQGGLYHANARFLRLRVRSEHNARVHVAVRDVCQCLPHVFPEHEFRLNRIPQAAMRQGLLRVSAGRNRGGIGKRNAFHRRAAQVFPRFQAAAEGRDQNETIARKIGAGFFCKPSRRLQGVHFFRRRGREHVYRSALRDLLLQGSRRAEVEPHRCLRVRFRVRFADLIERIRQRSRRRYQYFVSTRPQTQQENTQSRGQEKKHRILRRK